MKIIVFILLILVSINAYGKDRKYPKVVLFETDNSLLTVREDDSRQTSANEAEVAKIIKLSNESKYSEAKIMAEGMLRSVKSERLFYEYGKILLALGDLKNAKASFQNSLIQIFASELPEESLYMISAIFSSQGDIQESIQYLKYAIDRGFTDWNRIESDPLLEKLRRSKEWEVAKISLKQKLLIPLESNVVGAMTDLGPSTIVVYLICPNRKLVTFSEGDYDIEKKLYFGKWSLNQNKLELVTEKKCFAEGQGKAFVNHNDRPTYKSYRYAGCKAKDKKNSDLASTDFTLSKSSFAALFRQYYGEEFEVDGIGYRYHKFTNGFPIQCKDNFIPKSVKDLELETRQYLKAY